jgi:hypothetical protein
MDLPMSASYGGCKSWIELEQDVDPAGAAPALSDAEFAERLQRFESNFEVARV